MSLFFPANEQKMQFNEHEVIKSTIINSHLSKVATNMKNTSYKIYTQEYSTVTAGVLICQYQILAINSKMMYLFCKQQFSHIQKKIISSKVALHTDVNQMRQAKTLKFSFKCLHVEERPDFRKKNHAFKKAYLFVDWVANLLAPLLAHCMEPT